MRTAVLTLHVEPMVLHEDQAPVLARGRALKGHAVVDHIFLIFGHNQSIGPSTSRRLGHCDLTAPKYLCRIGGGRQRRAWGYRCRVEPQPAEILAEPRVELLDPDFDDAGLRDC